MHDGADEIDLMPNVGFLVSGMEKEYLQDIRGVVEAAKGIPVKVMLELPLLNVEQKERAVALSVQAGVAYLKNASSGAVGVARPEERPFSTQAGSGQHSRESFGRDQDGSASTRVARRRSRSGWNKLWSANHKRTAGYRRDPA